MRRVVCAVSPLVQELAASGGLDGILCNQRRLAVEQGVQQHLRVCARAWSVMLFDTQSAVMARKAAVATARMGNVRSLADERESRQLWQLLQTHYAMPQIFWCAVSQIGAQHCAQLRGIDGAADQIGALLRSHVARHPGAMAGAHSVCMG